MVTDSYKAAWHLCCTVQNFCSKDTNVQKTSIVQMGMSRWISDATIKHRIRLKKTNKKQMLFEGNLDQSNSRRSTKCWEMQSQRRRRELVESYGISKKVPIML